MLEGDGGPRVSDDAVRAKTGRGWQEWFALLDAAGAAELDHKGIVAAVAAHGDVSAWWQQSVSVEYARARGLREKHQQPDGYQVGGNRTIAVPVETLFDAWHDESRRRQWLEQPIVIRKATAPKSLRITWSDDTHVDVYLVGKGAAKSQVTVGHRKIADAGEADRLKAFWAGALDRLKQQLEADS